MQKLTSSDNIINNQHLLPLLHSISLHLEEVLAVLLLEPRRHRRPRNLSLLPDRRKRTSQSHRQPGSEQEPPRVERDDDIRSTATKAGEDFLLERGEEGGLQGSGGEER